MTEDDADRAAREWLKQSRLAERYHVGSLAAMLRHYGQEQREQEREACAEACDSMVGDSDGSAFADGRSIGRDNCAIAIRARGASR